MWCKVGCMKDRDDFAGLVGSARSVLECPSFYFNGIIRYGTKGEKLEERLLCMDAIKVYICSVKIPVKIESQFNILSIKLIERVSDSQVSIETDEKQTHTLYGLHDKSSLQPFLIVLIRNLHGVFPHRLQAIVKIRPENEYDKLLRLANEYQADPNILSSECRPCGGFSLRYECACDLYQVPLKRSVQNLVDSVFAHRMSRQFTFREFETLTQKEWLPIISALRYNDWFTKLVIENAKLSPENIDELCTVMRLSETIRDLQLINCGLRHDFCSRFAHSLLINHIEHLDLSNNALEDRGLLAFTSSIQQRKSPLFSLNLQSCSLSHKSLHSFNSTLMNNDHLVRSLRILNLTGNRIREENCITNLFQNSENVLEELHLSDIEFSLDSFFRSLAIPSCKLRRLFISSIKSFVPPSTTGGVKLFFTHSRTLEIVQLSNASLSIDFLREFCDGLHSNVHLNKLDLRLFGNQLEGFVHEYAARVASIPSLSALDLTGCDLDNEIAMLLNELRKNRKLKSLHIGKNFNNIKTKYIGATIDALKDLVTDSNLEYLSIADSKLKDNLTKFLMAVTHNTSLKALDIRGNLLGYAGVRAITHILQMNSHLHTLFLDGNLSSINNFEDIVNAMEENSSIQYLPVPVTDIMSMKLTEKERMEKIPMLTNKLDSICTRNQQQRENVTSSSSLLVATTGNLTREMNLSWEYQQQLLGDQASLDYIHSCSNRINNNNNNHHQSSHVNTTQLKAILTGSAQITEISSRLQETYIAEEERLKDEWNEMCQKFKQKSIEKNERLSREFYQLFKEQTAINYDDKFQEHIRTIFAQSNEQIDQLLTKEIPNKLTMCSRQCYVNVATSLQKRAYDRVNDNAGEMIRDMEKDMFQSSNPPLSAMIVDGQSSTLERTIGRSSMATSRSTSKHSQTQAEFLEELSSNHRQLKKSDSSEPVATSSPSLSHSSTARLVNEKDPLSVPLPSSPKPSGTKGRKSAPLNNNNEQESTPISSDPIYGNVPVALRQKKKQLSVEDEGDLIEHDLLDLVEQEEQKEQQRQAKNTPPPLPTKKRAPILPTTSVKAESPLDLDTEPTAKLIHPGKDRPRPVKVKRSGKRSNNDSSSDGGLLTDENDDTSTGDVFPKSTSDVSVNPLPSTELRTNEAPQITVGNLIKSALKTSKANHDDSPPSSSPIINKTPLQVPTLQPRPSVAPYSMSKSMISSVNDPPQITNSDFSTDSFQTKGSMSTSLYSSSNTNEEKDLNHSTESIASPAPAVLSRTGKPPMGPRVLPVIDPNGDAPPVRLRHVQIDRRGFSTTKQPSTDNVLATDIVSSGVDNPSTSVDSNEQYKQLSVKERARRLTTTNSTAMSNDKKLTTPINTPTSV